MSAQEAMQEDDEFSAADAAAAAVSGYEATRNADVEDQREYRMIPAGTPCTLGIAGFTYNPATGNRKANIAVKFEVAEPEQYSDGSSNFVQRFSLNAVVGKNDDGSDKKSSGWDMTVQNLSWLYAAVNQVSAAEGKREMIDVVFADFPNLDADDIPAFHNAIVVNANEKLQGSSFKTKGIGVEKGQEIAGKPGQRYQDKQVVGKYDYPKATK